MENPAMTFLAAAIQMTASSDKAANLERAERLVRVAAARGANLVALPEVFNWRGKRSEQAQAAETLDGQTLALMSKLARELRIHLLAGSITEHAPGETRCYNTSVLLDREGARVAVYRKIHLFDVELPGRVTARESDAKLSGADVVCAETALGPIGLSICYDLRFPELYRRLTFAGARIIAIPSAFTFPTGEAHWEPLIRARAIENQAYVIAPAQFGPNVYGYSDYGNSMIVDPWGRVLARAADQEGVVVAPIDLQYQDRVRSELPALKHARLHRESR
ncbi:MAG: carbon-nitrogen hydrolase family protein [Candidatus Binatus sp.]|uniref:carbon-nitrogen hydrolase family protein n=1 Tax=Candidatus Binatus sp. TaxID=2811406 RepID=UPI002720F37F|nr:carbon-nitrogen hydrolase family protein [Candidatus Binatus sp.]MDO8431757.1 carbon-nitrogen hydrolase family protein [Candidatus Binatus sp.]